jgi:hypothetical protein
MERKGIFMRSVSLLLAAALLVCFTSSLQATIIHVPTDSTTIQGGINGAVNGDTVVVHPGTYVENINFLGKAIVVMSQHGADVTAIDGMCVASFSDTRRVVI